MGKRNSVSRIPVLLNIEPHYVELYLPYRRKYVTVDGIIEAARKYCVEQFSLSTLFPRGAQIQLRYITDSAQAFDRNSRTAEDVAAHLGLTSTLCLSSDITRDRATVWYREIGHRIVSEVLPSSSPPRLPDSSKASTVQLYVVIPVAIEPQMHRPHFLPLFNEQFGNRIKYLRATKDDLQRRMSTLDIAAPSIVSKSPSKLDGVQASSTHISMGYCPHGVFGPLPALFCPAFAYAHNMSKDLPSVNVETPAGVNGEPVGFHMEVWVTQFAECCGAITEGEAELGDTIDEYLRQLFDDKGLTRHAVRADDVGPAFEVDWMAECRTAHGLPAIYLAIEIKETPLCGGDPVTQVALSLRRSLALQKYEDLLRMSCCPCLIMGIAGFQVTVVLAYFTDCLHMTDLFTISLKGSRDPFAMKEWSAKFQIVRDTAKRLREWYATIHTGSTLPHVPYLFPQPSSIFALLKPYNIVSHFNLASLDLIFTEKVGPPEKSSRCLYKGVLINLRGPPTEVFIKFVDRPYGQAQHQLLADHSLAPQLRVCCEIVRGTTMVIMDNVGGCSLTDGFARKYIPTLRRDLTAAVNLLRARKWVHGDLRPENVVLRREEDGTHAYLIDFEWAGVALEARYPTTLSNDINWPRPVEEMRGRVIRDDDDLIMLANILRNNTDDDDSAKRSREGDMTEGGGGQPPKKSRQSNEVHTSTGMHPARTGTQPACTSTGSRPARTSTGSHPARTSTGSRPARTSTGSRSTRTSTGSRPSAGAGPSSGAKPRARWDVPSS